MTRAAPEPDLGPALHRGWRAISWLLLGLSAGVIAWRAIPGGPGWWPERAVVGVGAAAVTLVAFRRTDPRRASTRLPTAGLFGAALALALPSSLGWPVRLMAGWVVAAITLLVFAFGLIFRSDPAETRRRAAAVDPGRRAVLVIVVASSLVSIVASATVTGDGGEAVARTVVLLRLLTVLSAWLVTQVSYTLHYAHLYYGDATPGGLEFPRRGENGEADEPDDFDFAYFAFIIGMAFQTADVAISGRDIRRAALWHSLISFAFNTAIFANTLNLIYEFFKP